MPLRHFIVESKAVSRYIADRLPISREIANYFKISKICIDMRRQFLGYEYQLKKANIQREIKTADVYRMIHEEPILQKLISQVIVFID